MDIIKPRHQLRSGGEIKQDVYLLLIAMFFTRKGQKTPLPVSLQLYLPKKKNTKEPIPNKKQKQIPERQYLSLTNQKVKGTESVVTPAANIHFPCQGES